MESRNLYAVTLKKGGVVVLADSTAEAVQKAEKYSAEQHVQGKASQAWPVTGVEHMDVVVVS
jgi:hypothetical protein